MSYGNQELEIFVYTLNRNRLYVTNTVNGFMVWAMLSDNNTKYMVASYKDNNTLPYTYETSNASDALAMFNEQVALHGGLV